MIRGWTAFFVVAYAVAFLFKMPLHALFDAMGSALSSWPVLRGVAESFFLGLANYLAPSYALALAAATFFAPLAVLARFLARARLRAGLADPLEGARGWVAEHPTRTRALLALPALAWAAFVASFFHGAALELIPWVAVPGSIAAVGHFVLARAGLRGLLAPTGAGVARVPLEVAGDAVTFDAVAVTLETRAAVAGMAALPVVLLSVLGSHAITSDAGALGAVTAYVAASIGGVLLFRRASRIAVGLDGVLVTGSSRTRYYAYRDLDEARVRGANLELLRGGRTVVCLQLHGQDAQRRDAVLARVRESIRRADEGKRDTTAHYVVSASDAALGRVADGAGDYREAAISREQLWTVVEGPSLDGAARRAAARALVRSGHPDERARLRVAAERCAEPLVRVALEQLVTDGASDEDHEAPPAKLRASPLRG